MTLTVCVHCDSILTHFHSIPLPIAYCISLDHNIFIDIDIIYTYTYTYIHIYIYIYNIIINSDSNVNKVAAACKSGEKRSAKRFAQNGRPVNIGNPLSTLLLSPSSLFFSHFVFLLPHSSCVTWLWLGWFPFFFIFFWLGLSVLYWCKFKVVVTLPLFLGFRQIPGYFFSSPGICLPLLRAVWLCLHHFLSFVGTCERETESQIWRKYTLRIRSSGLVIWLGVFLGLRGPTPLRVRTTWKMRWSKQHY